MPTPAAAAAYKPITSAPAVGVETSLPAAAAPTAIPIMATPVITASPAKTPMPPETAHQARPSGLASSSSNRRSVSSDAQPDTRVAAPRPATMKPR